VNAHLANGLGNLLNRTMTLIDKNCEGKIPSGTVDAAALKVAVDAQTAYVKEMDAFEFAKALDAVKGIIDEANRYINDQKPWSLFKEGKNAEGAAVLLTSAELIKRAVVLLAPFTPGLSQKVWDQLGFGDDICSVKLTDSVVSNTIPTGQAVRNQGPVFQRLEDPAAAAKA
jgi:methionyl-tRNA synthetase